MQKISGKEVSEGLIKKLKSSPIPKKIFAAILVGNNPASISFLTQKERAAKDLGIDFRIYKFPEDVKNDYLREEVGRISRQSSVGGVVIQLPLPEHINSHYILNVIPKEKDVDVLSERAIGAFYAGRSLVLPPAVGVVEEILNLVDSRGSVLGSRKVAIIGPGFLIGKPAIVWLIGKVGNICIIDKGGDMSEIKKADLIILGTGAAGLISPDMLKKGAGVIDFGYARSEEGKLIGDFDSEKPGIENLSFYTPTPGGTGPILVAKLFENFIILNDEKKRKAA
jgi:methylenetetrahydrofolate dehydrogenase (NADP+)/methenyltetrahydrofolate cyclohydrolase